MEGPGLSVGAVARRLGVAPSTLRTWDRRYGIGPSRRSAGSHRRYDAADLARLELMNRLILEGAPPEEAARTALATSPPDGEAAGTPAAAAAPGPGSGIRTAGPPPVRDPAAGDGASWKGSGGNRLAVPGGTPQTKALARAAMALDDRTIDELITSALAQGGVARTWNELLVPVLIAIGDRFGATGAGVEIEHLLSDRVLSALAPLTGRPGRALNQRPVLLACAEDEQHSLAVHALGATLATGDVAVRILGARTPSAALAEAIERTGPAVVFVWSRLRSTGDPGPIAALPGRRPALRLVVGGPGWADEGLPSSVRRVSSLLEAVEEIRGGLGLRLGL